MLSISHLVVVSSLLPHCYMDIKVRREHRQILKEGEISWFEYWILWVIWLWVECFCSIDDDLQNTLSEGYRVVRWNIEDTWVCIYQDLHELIINSVELEHELVAAICFLVKFELNYCCRHLLEDVDHFWWEAKYLCYSCLTSRVKKCLVSAICKGTCWVLRTLNQGVGSYWGFRAQLLWIWRNQMQEEKSQGYKRR
jgi:hypothetical protein